MSSMNMSHNVTGPGAQRTDQVSAAAELAALKTSIAREEARLRAKYTGWKPLTIWYTLWALLIGFASVTSLFAGQLLVFLGGALLTGLVCLYAKYLYGGGRYRVWFVVF